MQNPDVDMTKTATETVTAVRAASVLSIESLVVARAHRILRSEIANAFAPALANCREEDYAALIEMKDRAFEARKAQATQKAIYDFVHKVLNT